MKNEFKGVTGRLIFKQSPTYDNCVTVSNENNATVFVIEHGQNFSEEKRKANAAIIAEAFNTVNETGYTPKQLAEQKAELLEALKSVLSEFKSEISARELDEERFYSLSKAEAAIKNAEQ